MNREIKFRAWDKELKHMHTGNQHHSMGLNKNGELISDNLIYMQYTGLKDKNGKKIYEGDIIKRKWRDGNDEESGIVKWISRSDFMNYSGWYAYPSELPFGDDFSEVSCEIIGNVYENKDKDDE